MAQGCQRFRSQAVLAWRSGYVGHYRRGFPEEKIGLSDTAKGVGLQESFQGENGLSVKNSRVLLRQPSKVGNGVVCGDEIKARIIQGGFGVVFQGVGEGVHLSVLPNRLQPQQAGNLGQVPDVVFGRQFPVAVGHKGNTGGLGRHFIHRGIAHIDHLFR